MSLKQSNILGLDSKRMTGLTSLAISNSFLKNRRKKIELHTDFVDSFSFTELKDELHESFGLSDFSSKLLQHEIIGPRNTRAYRMLASEKRQIDGYNILRFDYTRCLF